MDDKQVFVFDVLIDLHGRLLPDVIAECNQVAESLDHLPLGPNTTYAMNKVLNGCYKDMGAVFETHMQAAKPALHLIETTLGTLRKASPEIFDHTIYVTGLYLLMLQEYRLPNGGQLSPEEIAKLCAGSLLHDCGKIFLPAGKLNKSKDMTPEEIKLIKKHVEISAYAIERLNLSRDYKNIISDVASKHHELLNGEGYPGKLEGDELSKTARMFAICDKFESMTSDRNGSYAMPIREALANIYIMAIDRKLDFEAAMEWLTKVAEFMTSREKLAELYNEPFPPLGSGNALNATPNTTDKEWRRSIPPRDLLSGLVKS